MRPSAAFGSVLLASASAFAQHPRPAVFATDPRPAPAPVEQFAVADYMAPAEGRVRMEFQSEGRVQSVVVERRLRTEAVDRAGRYHDLLGAGTCLTPCVMFIPPGPIQVRTHGPGLRDGTFDLDVPHDNNARVTLRAGLRGRYDLGAGLAAAGATVFIAELLVAAVAQGVGAPSAPPMGVPPSTLPVLSPSVAITVASVAGALLATGIVLLVGERTGVAGVSRTPSVAAAARWTPTLSREGAAWAF